ncbi:hypothetical protein Ddye_015636 [Dipteronia dyeriana]|uniref:Uncharacterized protein n=1 Tax=Dipteronia dyeriana TaxID=168575 RepID=A0AAD9U5M5_9ROSI|nr:hypothetical protein Ddye_015636 [Dipteronia dyeriana]
MTGFYRHLETSQRHHEWSLIRWIRVMPNLPWASAEDFIEILYESEKVGGLQQPRWQLDNFRMALDECGLQDIGFVGPPFTWYNKRKGTAMIQERLDRCMCSFQWKNMFPEAMISHQEFWKSDHRQILLDTSHIHGSLNLCRRPG